MKVKKIKWIIKWLHGEEPIQPKSRLEGLAAMYKEFTDPKSFVAHKLVSEILRHQIPYEVSNCQYGLRSDELKKGIKQYMMKHPNF